MKKFGIVILVMGILVMIAFGAFQNGVSTNEYMQRVNRQTRNTMTMSPDYAGQLVKSQSSRESLKRDLQAAGVEYQNVNSYISVIQLYSVAPAIMLMGGLATIIGLVLFVTGKRRNSFSYLVMM